MPSGATEFDPPYARLPAWLRPVYERVAFAFVLAFFGVGGLIYTVLGPILYFLLPRRIGNSIGQTVMTGLFRMYLGLQQALGLMRLDLTELDQLRGERGLVLAPNHPTLLDAMFVISRLRNTTCIMKAGIHDNVFLGGGAKLAGYIRNDAPVRMIKIAAREVRAGRLLLVFPEGTRTAQHPVNPFKGSFALIAREAGAPIQTILIETNSPYLTKGWPLLRKPAFPLIYRARLGRRFEVSADTREQMTAIEDYFRQVLAGK